MKFLIDQNRSPQLTELLPDGQRHPEPDMRIERMEQFVNAVGPVLAEEFVRASQRPGPELLATATDSSDARTRPGSTPARAPSAHAPCSSNVYVVGTRPDNMRKRSSSKNFSRNPG